MDKARRDRTGGLSGRSPDREIRRPWWGLWLKGTPLSWLRWCSPYPEANRRLRAEVPTTNSRAVSSITWPAERGSLEEACRRQRDGRFTGPGRRAPALWLLQNSPAGPVVRLPPRLTKPNASAKFLNLNVRAIRRASS